MMLVESDREPANIRGRRRREHNRHAHFIPLSLEAMIRIIGQRVIAQTLLVIAAARKRFELPIEIDVEPGRARGCVPTTAGRVSRSSEHGGSEVSRIGTQP